MLGMGSACPLTTEGMPRSPWTGRLSLLHRTLRDKVDEWKPARNIRESISSFKWSHNNCKGNIYFVYLGVGELDHAH